MNLFWGHLERLVDVTSTCNSYVCIKLIVLCSTFQVILVFKAVGVTNMDSNTRVPVEFVPIAKYQIAFPIHGLMYADVSGDGFKELVVLSVRGIHLFQVSLCDVQFWSVSYLPLYTLSHSCIGAFFEIVAESVNNIVYTAGSLCTFNVQFLGPVISGH